MGRNEKSNMYVDILALHNEVTGSCIHCTVKFPNKEKINFLVDCGLFQEKEYNYLNYSLPFNTCDISFVLVTHNHIDHIGRVPFLFKKVKNSKGKYQKFNGKVYASNITAGLMPIALKNTAEILSNDNLRNSNKYKKVVTDASIPLYMLNDALYNMDDVNEAMEHVEGVPYNKGIKVHPNITVTFISNGHLLGASSILVKISYKGEKPIYLFFSGDYAKSNTFFDVLPITKNITSLPVNVIEEATYGTTSSSTIVNVWDESVISAINNKETCICPVFSLGRAQEILLKLRLLQKSGRLSTDIPIYFDGKLAIEYTNFYLSHLDYLKQDESIRNFIPSNLKIVNSYEMRNSLLSDRNTKIILTTSGMGSYGPAQIYLPYYISRPKCTITFCGYTTPNSLGRKLISVNEGEIFELNGIMTKKMAKVVETNEFSGHAKKEDLIELLKNFTNIKTVLINHGEKNTKVSYAKNVLDEVSPKSVAILSRKNYIRIGAYGLIKTYPSNLDN